MHMKEHFEAEPASVGEFLAVQAGAIAGQGLEVEAVKKGGHVSLIKDLGIAGLSVFLDTYARKNTTGSARTAAGYLSHFLAGALAPSVGKYGYDTLTK
jgi:hypothetical protein